jgi:hypothetical protein
MDAFAFFSFLIVLNYSNSSKILKYLCFFRMTRYNTQALTTRTHTHPYEYTYANPTPMSTGRSRDSRSHQWRLVVDGSVAYNLTHTPVKILKNTGKKVRAPRFEPR